MAIRFDASGDYLTRTANLPSSTAFTLCGWFRRRAAGGATAEILFDIASAGHADYITAFCGAAGANGMYVQSTGGAPTGGTAITDDAWYFAALSCSGTGASAAVLRWAAVGATSFSSVSTAGKSFTLAQISVAGIGDAGFYGNLAAAGMQLYDRALTDAELLQEMNRLTPASTTNLNVWSPMAHSTVADAIKDFSGNGRDWTANGTLTIEDGPPVGWGGRIAIVGQAAAADVSVGLSGSSATASAGTLGASREKALSGSAATTAAGTITPSVSEDVTVSLTGSQVTASAGTVSTGRTVAFAGQAATASAGTITPSLAILAPTGLDANGISPSEIEVTWDTDVGDDSYDIRFRSTATPPSLSTQSSAPWHLERLSQRIRSETNEYKYRYTGDGVRIYIVDTGIRATHDQFGGRVIAGYNGTAGPDTDEDGHGTQVASSAAGSASGTAKGATLVPVKVARATTDPDWTTAYFGGLAWIAANHPAGVRGVVECAVPPPSGGTDGALEAAWQALLDAGLVCVQSAPNDGAETFPRLSAFPSEIIFVGGMGEVDTWSPYSNYGSFIDIAGPAQLLTGLAGIASDSAAIDSGGNSNATPMVAGICALLLEENPHATVDRIIEILLQQANIGVLASVPSGTPNVLAYSLATSTDWVTHTGVTEPYTIDGLEPSAEYEIQVRRTVDAQTSDWSSSVLATTGDEVAVALTGSASTTAAGTIAPVRSVAVSGSAATASAGTAVPARSVGLSGSAATGSVGSVTSASSVALAGSESASAVGTISANVGSNVTTALIGSAVTTSAGTLSPESIAALSGESVASAAGTVGVSVGEDVSVALTGAELTTNAGVIAGGRSLAVSGSEASAQDGSIAGYHDLGLSGIEVGVSAGAIDLIGGDGTRLTGSQVVASAGTVSVSILAGAGSRSASDRGASRNGAARPAARQVGARPRRYG